MERDEYMLVKQYDFEYMEILSSIEGEYLSKRQINKRIAKKWNFPYKSVQRISKESDELNNRLKMDELSKIKEQIKTGELSDGYHTFNELYDFRRVYNQALFNEWASQGKYNVHKSIKHHDGELCFGGGWFIVVAVLPTGQISNHYEMKYWDDFRVHEAENALFEFDGHTAKDVIERLKVL